MEPFKITFGEVQKICIDPVLDQLMLEDLVKKYSSEKHDDHLVYSIEFTNLYGCYRFGHDQVIYVTKIFGK